MISFELIENNQLDLMPSKEVGNLSILWNTGGMGSLTFDGNEVQVNSNCIIFLSEFFMEVYVDFKKGRIITFNKDFLSPVDTLNTIGEYLMLFYGSHTISGVPKITLRNSEEAMFEKIWQDMLTENVNTQNPISEALLRNSLSRFLLLSQNIHMETEFDIPIDFKDLKKIREFQYLVNNNFKELTKVSDYAQIMKISAKKISEVFGCCYHKKASELIADRRNLFAKRQLMFTDELIKNIAYDLNFSDSQTFSHFFKKQNRITPEEYRKNNSDLR